MTVTNKLKVSEVKSFKAKDKPYKKTDGGGMYIEVRPNGSKWWRLAYRLNGKQQLKSLGVYPKIGLYEARRLRDEFDPSPKLVSKTLELVFQEFMIAKKSGLSAKHQASMQSRCAPILESLGTRPIKELKPSDFLPLLKKIEERSPSVVFPINVDAIK